MTRIVSRPHSRNRTPGTPRKCGSPVTRTASAERARSFAKDFKSAFAQADVCIVHNDWSQWRDLTAKDFAPMRRKVVIDGPRILDREKMEGVDLIVLGG
ncbi:MAG: UDP binding domain-containing protein [Thermoplasmata archaeon]